MRIIRIIHINNALIIIRIIRIIMRIIRPTSERMLPNTLRQSY